MANSGCSQGGGKAMRGVSRAREIENRGSNQKSQAESGVSPGLCPGRARGCGRPGEGKPCFPAPALLRRGPVCTHSGVNHRPRGRAGQCAAPSRRRGRGLVTSSPTLPRSGATKPLPLSHPRPHAWPGRERRSFLVSPLPLVGCVPSAQGRHEPHVGPHSSLRVGLRLVIGLVKEGQIFFFTPPREKRCVRTPS